MFIKQVIKIKVNFSINFVVATTFLIIVAFCLFPNTVIAQTIFFEDNFDFLNESIWTKNGEGVNISGGKVVLGSNTDQFPFLTTDTALSSLSQDDFEIEVVFRYISVNPWGNGITFGNVIPPYPASQDFMVDNNGGVVHFQVWQDSSSGEGLRIKYHHTEEESANEAQLFTIGYNDTETHTWKIKKSGATYSVFVDEELVFTKENSSRMPVTITVGNPISMYLPALWSSFEIDKIVVRDFGSFSENLTPLLLIPGFGASWNTEAIVYGNEVDPSQWKMTPFVNTYDRLLETAQNNGYTPGEDLFVWNYDWRKPLSEISLDLNQFIELEPSLDSAEKIDFVGHSFGGLTARTWIQNYDTSMEKKTGKLITAGSPHQGVVRAYTAFAGGKIGEKAELGWSALQLLLKIKGGVFKTTAESFRENAPSLRDLVPTFDFIKTSCCGIENQISAEQITYPNSFLAQLNQSADILPFSSFVLGNNGVNTEKMLLVRPPSVIDQVLGLWPDGKPYQTLYEDGDGLVLKESAYLPGGHDPELEYSLDHQGVINDPATVEKIMEILGKEDVVVSGPEAYLKDDLLVFYLASPASLEVDGLAPADNDLQFVVFPNPESKQYQATVTGTDSGIYHLFVGQMTQSGNFWQSYQGETQLGETKTYDFEINMEKPLPDPLVDQNGLNHFETAKQILEELYQQTSDKNILDALSQLNLVVDYVNQGRWRRALIKIKKSLYFLARFKKRQDNEIDYAKANEALVAIAFGWENILRNQNLASGIKANREYRLAKGYHVFALGLARIANLRGRPIPELKALSIKKGQDFLEVAKGQKESSSHSLVEVYSHLARLFAWEGLVRR